MAKRKSKHAKWLVTGGLMLLLGAGFSHLALSPAHDGYRAEPIVEGSHTPTASKAAPSDLPDRQRKSATAATRLQAPASMPRDPQRTRSVPRPVSAVRN